MSFWSDLERYYNYKLIRALDSVWSEYLEQRRKKKIQKKQIIKKYGYIYYINDKLWNRIKDQKPKETYFEWKDRLKMYGFTTSGVFITTGEMHPTKPLVHQYVLEEKKEINIKKSEEDKREMSNKHLEEAKDQKDIWKILYDSYLKNPHDTVTVPNNKREGVWYFVKANNDEIWIDNAKQHKKSSRLSMPRKLEKHVANDIYELYLRRKQGHSVFGEAKQITMNQSYWYGIFSDLKL